LVWSLDRTTISTSLTGYSFLFLRFPELLDPQQPQQFHVLVQELAG